MTDDVSDYKTRLIENVSLNNNKNNLEIIEKEEPITNEERREGIQHVNGVKTVREGFFVDGFWSDNTMRLMLAAKKDQREQSDRTLNAYQIDIGSLPKLLTEIQSNLPALNGRKFQLATFNPIHWTTLDIEIKHNKPHFFLLDAVDHKETIEKIQKHINTAFPNDTKELYVYRAKSGLRLQNTYSDCSRFTLDQINQLSKLDTFQFLKNNQEQFTNNGSCYEITMDNLPKEMAGLLKGVQSSKLMSKFREELKTQVINSKGETLQAYYEHHNGHITQEVFRSIDKEDGSKKKETHNITRRVNTSMTSKRQVYIDRVEEYIRTANEEELHEATKEKEPSLIIKEILADTSFQRVIAPAQTNPTSLEIVKLIQAVEEAREDILDRIIEWNNNHPEHKVSLEQVFKLEEIKANLDTQIRKVQTQPDLQMVAENISQQLVEIKTNFDIQMARVEAQLELKQTKELITKFIEVIKGTKIDIESKIPLLKKNSSQRDIFLNKIQEFDRIINELNNQLQAIEAQPDLTATKLSTAMLDPIKDAKQQLQAILAPPAFVSANNANDANISNWQKLKNSLALFIKKVMPAVIANLLLKPSKIDGFLQEQYTKIDKAAAELLATNHQQSSSFTGIMSLTIDSLDKNKQQAIQELHTGVHAIPDTLADEKPTTPQADSVVRDSNAVARVPTQEQHHVEVTQETTTESDSQMTAKI